MPTTQAGRTLKVTTPLDDDFLLIKRLRAAEQISHLFRFDVEMVHDEEEAGNVPTLIDPEQMLGQKMTVTVLQPDGTKRFFNGMCVEFTQGSRNHRWSHFHAELVPSVWILTQNSQSRIFQNLSVPEILRQVFEGFEVDHEIQGNFEARNYCVQYRESDFDFASRLMEEEGIYYYFEHTENSHRMILGNMPGSHRELPGRSTIRFGIDISDNVDEWEGAIRSWRAASKSCSGRYTLRDHNFQLPKNSLEANAMNSKGMSDAEIYDYPGGYAKRFDGIDSGGREQSGKLNKIFDDRERTTSLRQQEIDVAMRSSYGMSDCCALTPGYRFRMTEHPNPANNRNHLTISVKTEAIQTPAYLDESSVANAYVANFTCIPQGDGSAPFRPIRRTVKPLMRGSQTAVVTGPSGEEIFVDKFGRVKVQFHWDRDGKYDATSSCWLRVSTGIAGNKWGTMFIPRIGQEVIVDFLEGDPDRPIITGAVYNPETMPHYELPKFKTLTYIKTRTSPDDGKGFNELRFEDKKDKEQVFVHSQKRYDLRVKESMYETCGANRQESIGVRSDNKPGGNLAITVGGSYDLHVKKDEFIGIDGKLNETVKGDVVKNYEGGLSLMVKGKAESNAQNIILEASTKISLKVGGSCVVIDPSGVTIAGSMVKINSGGFGTETGDPSIDDPMDAETADTGAPGYLDRPRSGGGRTRRSRKLKSQHHIAPPRPGEDPRITSMRNTLANSAQGRHALEVYDRYGVDPTFNAGEGSYFSSSDNRMNLDPSEDPTTSALTFTHEMNHAEAHHEGRSANVDTQNRNDYVDTMLDEETEGTVRSIEARNELAANGTDVSGSHFPLENEYQQAHDQAVANARAADPNISDEQAEAIGREAGRQRVRQGFDNGEVVPSTSTGQTYPDYYGGDWDAHHPGGGGTP
ncbi:MAG: type VI secretion system tip protein VgrG [Chloracidobacterium sp.]|nr:type VI secretion system tip protein VgrG [Chloracidobacterium sp.]MCC6825808.1 type VI secretion system tip protein VgrG [Acidobacteriota bacterium]MCO5332963.1 type VI secretion system tip protein VgrG [Pyrinomonadaceae bacterium]